MNMTNSHSKNNSQELSTNRDDLRKRYWAYSLPIIQKQHANSISPNCHHTGTFSNCNPVSSNTSSGFFGIGGFKISCIANYDSAKVLFYMGSFDTAKNKASFDLLRRHKNEIEEELGISLVWERADAHKASWISYNLPNVSIANEADWEKIAKFHAEWSDKICNAVLPYLQNQ